MSEKKKYLLRLDERLYAALERWAAHDLRSVNAQIEFLLTDAVRKAGRANPQDQNDDTRANPDSTPTIS
ncbi:MAG: hypothetical protein FJ217_04365 [Ignavibacteria bacterium]|nr:hypothetical protein [Ignavibacteria bacterium]